MKKHLKFIDGTSDKFWQIEVTGSEFTVTFGRNGTSGVSQLKSFDSPDACLKAAEKLLAEKIKKGYSEDGTVSVEASNAAPRAASGQKSDLKAVLAEFDQLVESADLNNLLPFLQEKTRGNLAGFKKHLVASLKHWTEYVDDVKGIKIGSQNWRRRGTDMQVSVIVFSGMAVFDKTEIMTWNFAFNALENIDHPTVREILLWAKPNWIDAFLLRTLNRQPWDWFPYFILREIEALGLIAYSPELYARCLSRHHEFNHNRKTGMKTRAYIAAIVNDPVAWQRDVPALFEYQTPLNDSHFRDTPDQPYNAFSTWEIIFNQLLAENKLDRQFFIEKCLQIQTKDWNPGLRTFFRQRLDALNPTPEELTHNQEIIFTFLHAPLPPIVNVGVEYVKKIHDNPAFNASAFLDWVAPAMMRSDCKTALKSVLGIFEKLEKRHPELRPELALATADIFLIADLTLQEKAVKTLQKIAPENDGALSEKLAEYAPQMQGNVKASLAPFFGEKEVDAIDNQSVEDYVFAPQKAPLLVDPVAFPDTWNDILFQFGQYIKSDEPLAGEVLLNAFITQRHLFPADYAKQLGPYLSQLQRTFFQSTYKDFIRDFLIAKIPNLDTLYTPSSIYIPGQTFTAILLLLQKTDEKMRNGSGLPLLSLPTHAPYWIEPKVLLERLIAYAAAGEQILPIDLAIAISRMPRENTESALPLLSKLAPALQQLMGYCLGVHNEIKVKETSLFSKLRDFAGIESQETLFTALWAVAARTHFPDGIFPEFESTWLKGVPYAAAPFRPAIEFKERYNSWRNYKTQQIERSPSWYELAIHVPEIPRTGRPLLYCQDFYGHEKVWEYGLSTAGIIYFWHSMMPQNPDPMAYIMATNSSRHTEYSSGELVAYLDIVNRPEFLFSDMNVLLYCSCFFQKRKETRLMAVEVLINLIQRQALPAEKFGEKLAFLVNGKYGVFSRVADALGSAKDVSPLHNAALMIIFESFFGRLDVADNLPANFKKMVENYLDLLHKTGKKPTPSALAFFEKWRDSSALKGLIKQLNAL